MAKSAVDIAIANIDADIASLQRSKEIIINAAKFAPDHDKPLVRNPRQPRKPKGLPPQDI